MLSYYQIIINTDYSKLFSLPTKSNNVELDLILVNGNPTTKRFPLVSIETLGLNAVTNVSSSAQLSPFHLTTSAEDREAHATKSTITTH